MTGLLASFRDSTRAAAAAEMALCLPILMTLMFGGLEAGHFFFKQQQVVKAAREGARFAARQPMASYDCTTRTATSATTTKVQNLVNQYLTGSPTITVETRACVTGSATGLYTGYANGAPIAVVQIWLEYPSLFANLGFDTAALTLHATSQSAVTGL